jgi:hypothetical protein
MIKKILGLIMILVFSVIGLAETDISQIASDYPYKESAIMATVLGTPAEQQYKFKNPKGPKVRKFTTTKKIPEILRQWKDYDYGVWTQKNKKAPLMILISGTGSVYNSGMTLYLANVFYDKGYNIIAFSSSTTMPYIVSQSKNTYAGYIKDETKQMYGLIQQAISREKKDGMKVDKVYIGGYSLGGFQSLLIHEMDEKNNRKIGIEKSLLLNSPISILTATQKLDGFLVKNGVYDARSLEKYMDTIFSRLMYDKSIQIKDIEFSNLTTSLGKLGLEEKDFEMLTGLLFRFYSANMTFAGEVFSGRNAVGRLSDKKSYKRFDSVSDEFREGLSVSFDEYAKEILYPYLKKYKYPNLDFNEFISDFDLRSSQDFIDRNNKNIVFITSEDDILLEKEDLDYIKSTFSNRVLIPFGGHTGALWHKDVANLMVEKLEEN